MDYSKLEGSIERKHGKLTKSFPGTEFILWMNYKTYSGFSAYVKKKERRRPINKHFETKEEFWVKSLITCSGPLDIVVNDKLSEPYILVPRNFVSDLLFRMDSIAVNKKMTCNS